MWYFAGGDAGFYFTEQLKDLSWLPVVWRSEFGSGVSHLDRMWFQYPYDLVIKALATVGFSWWWIDKLLWISVLVIGVLAAHKLASLVLGNRIAALIASILYISNTYFLLLVSGGQIGVSLAYAFAPFVMYRIIRFSDSGQRAHLINGLFIALLVTFDLRIAFMVVLATVFWWYRSFITLAVAGFLHLFWILPVILASGGVSDLGKEFTNPGMLKFLSVADFPHALSLLHPNWPENLFGKVYFLQPEFLILPIIAFSSFIFLKRQANNRKLFTYFATLALIGVFFAKGVNPPAGGLFEWMFVHIPGFVMFRDPTKFYLYIAVGYSILIPYALHKINRKIVYAIFVAYWIFTLRGLSIPVTHIPGDYVQFKDMLVADSVPSRTLWIPQKQSFSYFSDTHPILSASTAADINPSVKYVVVPIDVHKRIFLDDYKYDPLIRERLIQYLSEQKLQKDTRFRELAVYVNPDFGGMQATVPATAARQQQLANIGLGISVGLLLLLLIWIFLH